MCVSNSRYPVLFVVRRTGESTIAIIQANVSLVDLMDQSHFKAALERVVTDWVLTTEDGKRAWVASSEDFNIGDLSHSIDESLIPLLASAGIEDLKIDCYSSLVSDADWTFDHVLVDTFRLEDG